MLSARYWSGPAVASPRERSVSRRRRTRVALTGVVGVALLLLLRCGPTDPATVGGGSADLDASRFDIEGDSVRALTPGRVVLVDLIVTNRQQQTMTVSDLTIAVAGVDAPHADRSHPCSVDDFVVEQPDAGLQATVPSHASRSLGDLGVPRQRWPRVGMVNRPANQDGCKDALVTLAYSGAGSLED